MQDEESKAKQKYKEVKNSIDNYSIESNYRSKILQKIIYVTNDT